MSVWVRNSKGRLETFEALFESLFDTPTSSPTSSIMAKEKGVQPEAPRMTMGLENENPYVHVRAFEEVINSFYAQNVIETAKLRFFPFSLKDKVKGWLYTVKPRSIGSWGEMTQEFYKKFFLPHKKQSEQNQRFETMFTRMDEEVRETKNHLAKLTNALSATEKGKLLSQTQPNPNNKSVKIVSKNNHEECKAVTILRSGKTIGEEVEKGIPKAKEKSKETQVERDESGTPKVNLPLLHIIKQMPAYAKVIKDLCTVKRKHHLKKTAFFTEQMSVIIQHKVPTQVQRSRIAPQYLVPLVSTWLSMLCSTLGASNNLLSFTVYQQMGLGDLKPTSMTLQLADRSVRTPKGMVEDVLIKIVNFYYHVDFIILDLEPTLHPDNGIPIIMGRPFLTTANTLINYRNGRMKITFGSMTAELNIFNVMQQQLEDDECHYVNLIDTMAHGETFPVVISAALNEEQGRRFIKDFSAISRPLCNLLLKESTFEWTESCEVAFKKLVQLLTSAPIMQALDWSLPFEIMCDASDYAVGAVLGQRKDKKPHVIYYASRTLNSAQMNYTTTKKKLLTVVFALDKFRSYLMGTSIVVFTDHAALRYLLSKKDAKARLIRWILLLQEFNLQIKDKKGVENVVADHLSRLTFEEVKEEIPIRDSFPDEQLFAVTKLPWYAHIVNYLVKGFIPETWTAQDRRKFFVEKPRHLPVEMEQRAYWAIKAFNFDLKEIGELRKFQMRQNGMTPYIVKEVFDYGAVVIEDPRDGRILKVNGQRLRPYLGEVVPVEETMSLELPNYGDAS
uniref:RNA-directed DNA polymerase n=1 Tax=Fagus sylvatica TaxID=28930 RepID=A0A2N9I0B9_FAGSY